MSKAKLKVKARSIITSLGRSGIKTLQDVLNTEVLSSDEKINYIRHQFTCYGKYTKTFYRNNEGLSLRNELNTFIQQVIEGKRSVQELITFNESLKTRLEAADNDYIQEQKLYLDQSSDLKKVIKPIKKQTPLKNLCPPPNIDGLSQKEKECLEKLPLGYCKASMPNKEKVALCMNYINNMKNSWKRVYKERLLVKDMNCYLVEMYLENRKNTCDKYDFSDLDFVKWRDVVKLARAWLLDRFDKNQQSYSNFITTTLPIWIKNNAKNHKSKILEVLNG